MRTRGAASWAARRRNGKRTEVISRSARARGESSKRWVGGEAPPKKTSRLRYVCHGDFERYRGSVQEGGEQLLGLLLVPHKGSDAAPCPEEVADDPPSNAPRGARDENEAIRRGLGSTRHDAGKSHERRAFGRHRSSPKQLPEKAERIGQGLEEAEGRDKSGELPRQAGLLRLLLATGSAASGAHYETMMAGS